MSDPVLNATLKGIEKSKSDCTKGKDPILPYHLRRLMWAGDFNLDLEFIVCVAALFMFRTLLRVSNVVQSDHTLMRDDVRFDSDGYVRIRSSKTTSKAEHAKVLPVMFSRDRGICAATWLYSLVKRFKRPGNYCLFSSPAIPVLTYNMFAKKFKDLTLRAGLCGDFASHSLRRGGATFMAMLDRPLDQIKSRGMWKSDCVFRYIVPPMASMLRNEKEVAKHC